MSLPGIGEWCNVKGAASLLSFLVGVKLLLLQEWMKCTLCIGCVQDYPSISQLAHKIAETKVTIIFAVTKDQIPVYRELSKLIEGSTVGELANDSSNIVDLVKDNYDVSLSLDMLLVK